MTASSPTSAAGSPDALIELLDRQRGLYRQLHALAQQQGAIVDAGDPDPLLSLLAQRQALVDRLGAINQQLEPYRDNWARITAALAPAQRQQVGQLTADIESLRNEILKQDDRDCRLMQQSQSQTGAELGRVARAGLAVRAYGPPRPPVAPRFHDAKG